MPTFTEVLPAQLSSPHTAMRWTPTGPACGVLRIDNKRTSVTYRVEELPCPDGRAWRFEKTDATKGDPEGDGYTPFCGRVPALDTCDCRGFLRHGKPCKHLMAVRAMILNGWA